MSAESKNSFSARSQLQVGDASFEYYRLDAVPGAERLPFSLKVLLENLLRTEDGKNVTKAQIEALAKVVVDKNLLVISDDIYRQLVYGDAQYFSIAAVSPEVAKRTISWRRSSNALRISPTQSCEPVNAASVAVCAMCVGFDVD